MNKMKKDLFALFVDLISKFKSMALSHFEKDGQGKFPTYY